MNSKFLQFAFALPPHIPAPRFIRVVMHHADAARHHAAFTSVDRLRHASRP
jgi:hypothetical protein